MAALQDRTDGELLAAFAERRDGEAFEALVRRHERLVLNVCLRILGDGQDALDAAQAVFLALAGKAGELDGGRSLAPWLHTVATGTAANARRARELRKAREREAAMKTAAAREDRTWEDVRPVLDRALESLPERYRRPIVLFHLEGKSMEETAGALGSTVGTVGSWLSRGRDLLRDRLVRWGVPGVTAGALAMLLSREAEAQAPAAGFAGWTAKAAVAGGAGGWASAEVAALAKGALRMMFWTKVKTAAVAGLAGAALLSGAVGIAMARSSAPRTAVVGPVERAELAQETASLPTVETAQDAAPARSSDLLAHWKFDDAKDAEKVADASGREHAGKVVGTAGRVEGKRGGAFAFDGKGGHVEFAGSADLERVHEGNYSLTAWFKPEAAPPGRESANDAEYGILIKAGWHVGLHYNWDRKFMMTHWLAGEKEEEPVWKGVGTWEEQFEPGAWYHVAGVVDRGAGKTHLFVNGELKVSDEWTPGAKARKSEAVPWRVGIANPGAEQWAWPARGAVDDVRVYNRALSPMDVKALFEAP